MKTRGTGEEQVCKRPWLARAGVSSGRDEQRRPAARPKLRERRPPAKAVGRRWERH